MPRMIDALRTIFGQRSSHGSESLTPDTSVPALHRPIRGWFIDFVQIDPAGVIRLLGWSRSHFQIEQAPEIYANGERLSVHQHYRYPRHEIDPAAGRECLQMGLAVEYLIPDELLQKQVAILLAWDGEQLEAGTHTFLRPHYGTLLSSRQVLHREHIYGTGLPNVAVHPEVVALAQTLPGPILDFGCGAGALLGAIKNAGIAAQGLEKESDLLKQRLPEELKAFVRFYDGTFPIPFATDQFRSVVCSEVLEHIPDFQSAISEIARVSSERALITVPDASAIPLGYRHGAVPWHLLEASHVNFFSQQSLEQALAPHFSRIEFGRIGDAHFNDTHYFVTLVALCTK